MTSCTSCGTKFDAGIFGATPTACPHCGRLLSTEEANKWHNVARVASLAEAGYLVNQLGTTEVSARIFDDRSFNAIAGTWDQAYIIQVPNEQVGQAAILLRQEASAAAFEDREEDRSSSETENLVFWRPVALMALAGVASFVIGQRFADPTRDDRHRPYAQSLVAAMEQIGRPLVTEPRGGGPRHRFIFHRERQAWYVQIDRDGDGHFERIREIREPAVIKR